MYYMNSMIPMKFCMPTNTVIHIQGSMNVQRVSEASCNMERAFSRSNLLRRAILPGGLRLMVL
jgi:hypothetical protein